MEEINKPVEAYFIGWMYSDGCVRHDKKAYSYSASIKLKAEESSEKVLSIFMEEFPEIFKKKFYETSCRTNEAVYIKTYNREFCLNLIDLGVLPQKSFQNKENLKVPEMSFELMKYFLRGLYDGDGNYFMRNGTFLEISLYMGNKPFLDCLQKWFLDNLNIKSGFHLKKGGNCYRLRITENISVKNFIDFVFDKNSDLTLSLERKLNTINSFNYYTVEDVRKKHAAINGLKRRGSKASEETKLNMSKARLGKKLSEQAKQSIKNKRRQNTIPVEVWKDSLLLGVYSTPMEIEEVSQTGYFADYIETVNKNGRNGYPFYHLSCKNVNAACVKNILYKGLLFKRQIDLGQIKLGELSGNS